MGTSLEDMKLAIAFKEGLSQKFTGLELTWIEYEILRQVPKGVDTMVELSSYLEKKFIRNTYSQSQYYRIVQSLVKRGYLEEAGKRKKRKLLKLTPKGARELGHHQRYILDYLQEATILADFSKMIVTRISKFTGCLRDKAIMGVAAQAYPLPYLVEACLHCEKPSQKANIPIFLALPDSIKYVDVIHEDKIQYIDSQDPYDWLPKDESMDVIILTFVLNVLDPEKVLKEAWRVLRPGGFLICMELVNGIPDFILRIFNDVIANDTWEVQKPIMKPEETKKLLEQAALKVLDQTQETILISTLAQKQ